jgi:hypothetical protein
LQPEQLSVLLPPQVAALGTAQIWSLSNAQLQALTPAQIGAIRSVDLGTLLPLLRAEQIQGLSKVLLAGVNPNQLRQLTNAQPRLCWLCVESAGYHSNRAASGCGFS